MDRFNYKDCTECFIKMGRYPNENLRLDIFGKKNNDVVYVAEVTKEVPRKLREVEVVVDVYGDDTIFDMLQNMNLVKYRESYILKDRAFPIGYLNFGRIQQYLQKAS